MSAGRMSPLALGRYGSPNWSPSNSLDRPPPSLQRMQAVDLPSASELTNPGKNLVIFPSVYYYHRVFLVRHVQSSISTNPWLTL